MNHIIVTVVAAGVLTVLSAQSVGQTCENLRNARPEDLVSFLNRDQPERDNPECLTVAIYALGQKRYEPAIPSLAKFLDFRRLPNDHEKRHSYIRMQGLYPAVDALNEIGMNALPTVLGVIKGASFSAVARDNAVSVWMEIYKYDAPKGIAALREDEDKTTEIDAKQELKSALAKALTLCNPPDQGRCRAAAHTGYSKAPSVQ